MTAAMLANGGTKKLTFDEINQQFYPMATGFGWQVDKEMTTFSGSTHIDNLVEILWIDHLKCFSIRVFAQMISSV